LIGSAFAFTFLKSSDRFAWCFVSGAGFVLGSETGFSSGVWGEPGGVFVRGRLKS
jgi:hypothetical protein